jgi:hypothetical protein
MRIRLGKPQERGKVPYVGANWPRPPTDRKFLELELPPAITDGPTAEKAVPYLPVLWTDPRFPTRSKVPQLVSGLLSGRTSDARDHNAHTPYGSRGLVRQVIRVNDSPVVQ